MQEDTPDGDLEELNSAIEKAKDNNDTNALEELGPFKSHLLWQGGDKTALDHLETKGPLYSPQKKIDRPLAEALLKYQCSKTIEILSEKNMINPQDIPEPPRQHRPFSKPFST
jgi:hypothetical protein